MNQAIGIFQRHVICIHLLAKSGRQLAMMLKAVVAEWLMEFRHSDERGYTRSMVGWGTVNSIVLE